MFLYYARLCSNIGGNSEEVKRMAKLNFDAKKFRGAIKNLLPDTTDRILLTSDHGKVEITAEYDDDENAYYVLGFNGLCTTVFSSFDIWHTVFKSYLIMKEGDLKVGELLLNPFTISEVVVMGKDVTEAFA